MGKICSCFLFSKNRGNNTKRIKFIGRKAFSLAEAMIVLLLVSVMMAASAPLISGRLKSSGSNDVQIREILSRLDAIENRSAGIPSTAVMFFNSANCPIGWHPVPATWNNHFLRITSTAGEVGTLQTDGLPNITGSFDGNMDDFRTTVGDYKTGAFFESDVISGANGAAGYSGIIRFDASRSNAIYGAANEVRPKNVKLLACQKD